MIYFLNNDLQLQKIVTSENINAAQHEDEKNNLKMMTLQMDLDYTKSFLNDDIDHFGYYVGDDFHVDKIRHVEESHDGETVTIIGHHIFFEDMIYGRLIEDVRPENRDAAFILNQTIGNNTRWHPVITDTTGVLSTNFYWQTAMEVIEFVVENFRLEFQPEILFDGQQVNGLNVHFKKRLGEDKPRRVVFGPNTPSLQYDVDYSEIVTKLAVHGKGEEVGDGYGRRINFSDRNINRDGIVSPLGSRYLEDPNVTANYGNFNNEPKHANVIFEDIENVNELIEAGIEEYERLSRPQYIFTAEVSDIGDVNIGDSVLIVRRERAYNPVIQKRLSDLNRQLNEAKAELDGLEVGGRNLLLDSEAEVYNDSVTGRHMGYSKSPVEIISGEMYTISFDAKTSIGTDEFYASTFIRSGNTHQRIVNNMSPEESYKRYSFTFKATEDSEQINGVFFVNSVNNHPGNTGVLYLKNIQLEKGTIATDWTPAPEDVQQRIDELNQEIAQLQAQLDSNPQILSVRARVHKVSVNLLNPEGAEVVLGDYEHFAETKAERASRNQRRNESRAVKSRITQLKNAFDARFDGEVAQMWADYEQALIDAHAEIEAAEVRMTDRIETERNTMMDDYNTKVANAREHAEQQAQEKADAVQSNLESVTSSHQGLLDDLFDDVGTIDDFLGDTQNITLDQRFLDITETFDHRIRNASRDASNLIRGSQFDESSMYTLFGSTTTIETSENTNFARLNTIVSDIPLVRMDSELHLHDGVEYHFHIEYRTDAVTELDGFVFYHNDGRTERLENRGLMIDNLTTSGAWEHASMTLTPNAEMSGQLAIGTRRTFGTSPDGIIDIRLPYMTTTAHDQWLPHPLDSNQNITEISRRITQLEDGYSDFIVRSTWDAEMNSLYQTVRDYETTVEGVSDAIYEIENSDLVTRGREVLDAVDGFERKVWMGDIDRPNLIPNADILKNDNGNNWVGQGSRFNGSLSGFVIIQADSIGNYIGMESPKIYDYVTAGETYTLSWEAQILNSWPVSNFMDYIYLTGMSGNNIRIYNVTRSAAQQTNRYKYSATFEMPSTITEDTRILFGAARDGEQGETGYLRFRNPKLELGSIASPFKTGFSMLEQRADQIALGVAEIEDDYIKESSIDINSNRVRIASQTIIDDNQIASLINVGSESIDVITNRMTLNGDLLVEGDVTAIAIDAIEGEFASLWAAEFEAITIKAEDINGLTAFFEHLYTLNANIEKLVSQTAFINEINALSLNAVYGDISELRTELLTSNVILSRHVNSSMALIDKIFSEEAYIERLTSKSAFIRDIQAIEITANQLNLTTLTNRINQIEGGLRITRPDGVDWVRNGQARGHVPVQVSDGYAGANIRFNGTNFITGSSSYQTMKYFYTPHEGTRLRVVFAVGLFGGPSSVEFMHVRVRGFSGYNPINMGLGSSSQRVRVIRNETNYVTLDIPMAPPNYAEFAAYLEIRRDPDGQHSDNEVYARLLHIGQYE